MNLSEPWGGARMPVKIDITCRHISPDASMTVITMDNGFLRLSILPEAGAKIESIIHLPTGTELLWKNPAIVAGPVPPGSSYDDTWSGGWDELFPNDEPATVGENSYPDHGELWTCAWAYRIEEDAVVLSTTTPVTGCEVEKRIGMADGQPKVKFHHRLANPGQKPVPYLWKLHPALHVEPGDRLSIPSDRFVLEPSVEGTLQGAVPVPGTSQVRLSGQTINLLEVPPAECRHLYFFYGIDLREGWCALYRPGSKLAVGLAFPVDVFPTCWMFASYGGWRDFFVAVLEPCTGYPLRLEDIAAAGRERVLPPGASYEADVVFTVADNVSGIARITPDGQILSLPGTDSQ